MRTVGGLFERLVDRDHLDDAADATLRGKRRRRDGAWFAFNREAELARLRAALVEGIWQPTPFSVHFLRDPKPRAITCAPFVDRVLHTALVALAEPLFLASATSRSYACREGFGTHRAVLALQRELRRSRFVVHLDIRRYPSVHLPTLSGLLRRRIRDRRFLAVFDDILAVGAQVYQRLDVQHHARLGLRWPADRGLPIGALTSQMCAAHVYLAGLDHHIARAIKLRALRYMDDLFVFGDGRAELRRARGEIGRWLADERGLTLKHPDARVLSTQGHLDGLGHRLRRGDITPLPRLVRRVELLVDEVRDGAIGVEAFERRLGSTVGGVVWA